MSDFVQPHRWQPTRFSSTWDSLSKNTGVGCHCLLQCTKVKSESEVAQSCPTLSDPMDCSLPGSAVHGIFQARVLEWVAIAFSNMLSNSSIINFTKCLNPIWSPWGHENCDIGLNSVLFIICPNSAVYVLIHLRITLSPSSGFLI